jgi:hypothetical protein
MFAQSKGSANANSAFLDAGAPTTATDQLKQLHVHHQSRIQSQQQIHQELAYLNKRLLNNLEQQHHLVARPPLIAMPHNFSNFQGNFSPVQQQYLLSQHSVLFQQQQQQSQQQQSQQQQQHEQEYFRQEFQSQLPLSQNFQQPHINAKAAFPSTVEGGQCQRQQQQPQRRLGKRKVSLEDEDSEDSQQSTLDNLAAAAATAVRSRAPPSSSTSPSFKCSRPKDTPTYPQKRIQWTSEEDASLSALITKHGTIWTIIERELVMGRRSNKQCHDRWQSIDPKYERGEWSEVEKASLLELVEKYGIGRWSIICGELEVPDVNAGGSGKKRNSKQCRMQWYNHQENKNNKRSRREGVKAAKKRLVKEEEDSDEEW